MSHKAYTVTTDYAECCYLVFAESPSKAKAEAHGTSGLCDYEWTDLRCRREKQVDEFFPKFGIGLIDGYDYPEQKLMRDIGWHQLECNDDVCKKCELHVWDLVEESFIQENGQCEGCN